MVGLPATPRARRCLAAGAALLMPLLAQAYPRDNEALAALPYLALLVVATVVLVILAYRRPHERGLLAAQVVCLLLLVGLRLAGGRFFNIAGQRATPILNAIVPLALLLNGLAQARVAQRPGACRLWAGLAVAGSIALLWVLLIALHWRAISGAGQSGLALVVALAGWLVVLYQLRRYPGPAAVLWQPGGRGLAAAVAVCAGYFLFGALTVLLSVPDMPPLWIVLVPGLLQTAVACWLTGFAAFRMVTPLAAK